MLPFVLRICGILRRTSSTRRYTDTPEKEIEEEFEMHDEDYNPSSETLYPTPEDVQIMIEAALNAHEETKLHRLIGESVEIEVLNLFKKSQDTALADTYTKLYQMVRQSATRTIYEEKTT